MPLTARHILILLLILLCGFLLRTYKSVQYQNLEFDDQISLLAASGNLGHYMRFTAANEERPTVHVAGDWQQMLHPQADRTLAETVGTISADLRHYDVHPPLYFLWLHGVLRSTDRLTPQIGWQSNALFYLLNGVLLFVLGMQLLGKPQQALLAVLIWSMSTAAILTSIVARHYEMLTLFTLLSTLALLPGLNRSRIHPGWLLAYGVVVMLGFLANYQFLYHLAGLSVLVLFLRRHQWSVVLAYGVMTLLALGLALSLYPALLEQTREVATWKQGNLYFRFRNTTEEISKYCIVATAMLLVTLALKRDWLRRIDRRVWWLAGINLLALTGAYLAFVSPRHAMGDRYMASVGPFLSLLASAILFAFWQHRIYRTVIVTLILLPALVLMTKHTKTASAPTALRDAALVLTDFDSWGVLPGIALQLPPEQPMLVTSQDYLLSHPDWLVRAIRPNTLWISDPRSDFNSIDRQRRLLAQLRQQVKLVEVPTEDRRLRYFHMEK